MDLYWAGVLGKTRQQRPKKIWGLCFYFKHSSGGESNEVVIPARTRPQRVIRVRTWYVLSDSESDQPTDDSDFDGEDD